MSACFADAYYFLALLNPSDEAHAQAVALTAQLRRPIVTTAWIMMELADGLAATPARNLVGKFIRQLESNPRVTLIPPDITTFSAGVALYESRSDKRWSLTDCISFVVMGDHGLTDALTADRHFEQAGFRAILKGVGPA